LLLLRALLVRRACLAPLGRRLRPLRFLGALLLASLFAFRSRRSLVGRGPFVLALRLAGLLLEFLNLALHKAP